jgi:hypothetical protein
LLARKVVYAHISPINTKLLGALG